MQDIEKVFQQHEDSITAAHKMVMKESIDKDMPMSAEISFIYQNIDKKFYRSTTIVFSKYIKEYNTYATDEESIEEEISVDQFLDYLNNYNNENQTATKEAKRKRGRPRTRTS